MNPLPRNVMTLFLLFLLVTGWITAIWLDQGFSASDTYTEFWDLGAEPEASLYDETIGAKTRVIVTYTQTITNTSPWPLSRVTVNIPLPDSANRKGKQVTLLDSQYQIPNIQAKPFIDPQNRIGVLYLENLQGKETLVINHSLAIETAAVSYPLLDPARVGPYDTVSDLYIWNTQAAAWIESNHPTIRAKAEELAGGEKNPLLLARGNYQFVLDSMDYCPQPDNMGALYALEEHQGDCTEYTALFVAFCRAQGVPARVVFGAVIRPDKALQNHSWAEVFLPNYGWVPVDPTWGQTTGRDYFGHLSAEHIGFYYGLWNGFSHWYSPMVGMVQVEEILEPG